jgi:hypothetical protein
LPRQAVSGGAKAPGQGCRMKTSSVFIPDIE